MIDFSRCKFPPFEHQKIGIQKLLDNPYFALFDEMGAGKSLQVIVAAQILFERRIIDRVLIIAPASVRSVWYDPDLGELVKHLWKDLPACILEWHSKNRAWGEYDPKKPWLQFFVTNYEFIRSKARLIQLLPFCTQKTLLVLDESSAVKSHRAEQTKACLQLRKACGRVVLLNGTPIANNPMDMYSQGQIMNPSILACKSYFHARARYAIMGGWQQKQIIAWQNLEDLQARFKPYVLRRLKKDCLDLPEVMPPVTLTVPMTDEVWKPYKAMRDDMVSWLSDTTLSVASQAIVKSMRLAQITSGFLGGVEDAPIEDEDRDQDNGDFILPDRPVGTTSVIQEIGREKLDFTLNWIKELLEVDPNLKLLVWCRFIPELARFLREVKTTFPKTQVGCVAGKPLLGKTKNEERADAMRLLDPRTAPIGPVVVGGTFGTGGLGHNFTACHTTMTMSGDYSYFKKVQADARVDRPGQIHAVSNFDLVATGPAGQKTIDHIIVKARRNKEDIATWTQAAWIKNLTEE